MIIYALEISAICLVIAVVCFYAAWQDLDREHLERTSDTMGDTYR